MSQSNETSGFSQFMAETRRRHVVRFAFGYAAAAFVILQLAEIVFPAFGVGEGGLRILVVVTGLCFPPSLMLAWVYDITTDGIKRTQEGAVGTNPILSRVALLALLMATVAVTGGLGAYLAQQGVFETAVGDPERGSGLVRSAAYDPGVPIRSLAVLPLEDLSPGGDQTYFTSGMHEELISRLAMLDQVRVVSRTSVLRFAGTTLSMSEIARELGVDVIVEGSVSRTVEHTRIRLRVVHAPSETTIQTLEWDREELEDVLAFQTEVAHTVVHEIDSEHEEALFTRTADNINPAAQDAYFKGKYAFDRGTEDGYLTAFEYFRTALEEEPDFAPAMAGLAGARFLIGLGDPETASAEIAQAQGEARAALELEPTSIEALEVLAYIERSMPEVLGDDPLIPAPDAAPRIMHIMSMGEVDSILVDGAALDTSWVAAMTSLGAGIEERMRRQYGQERSIGGREVAGLASRDARRLMSAGRYSEAALMLTQIVEAAPEISPAWEMLARTYVAAGDASGAADVVNEWRDASPMGAPDQEWADRLEEGVKNEGARGYWLWQLDRLTMLEGQGRPVQRLDLAAAHAALGDVDRAFQLLQESLERGEPGIAALGADPVWDDLRGDPRFTEIARQVQSMRFSRQRRPARGQGPGNAP